MEPALQLGHRAGARLAVLHRLREEERKGGEGDLLLALAQAAVQDGGLGPEAGRHEGAGGHVGDGHAPGPAVCKGLAHRGLGAMEGRTQAGPPGQARALGGRAGGVGVTR